MNNITNYRTFQRNRNEFVVEALFEDINNQWLIINHSGEYAGFPAEIAITYKTKEEAENAIRIFESSNPNFQRSTNENIQFQIRAINEFLFDNLDAGYFVRDSHVNLDGTKDQSLFTTFNVSVKSTGPMALMFESITLKITTIYWPEVNITTLKLAYSYELASGGSNGSSVEYVCDQTGEVTTRDEYWKNRKDFINNL